MNEARIKHLELIQGVVTRLAQNSFVYKGWAITLVAAIFVLAAREANPWYLLVALLPGVSFWGLDSYYLRQERLFRQLYDDMRTNPLESWESDPFSMDTAPYNEQVGTWWQTCWSKSTGWLYGPMIVVVLAAACVAYG